jgi:hypothetical protein
MHFEYRPELHELNRLIAELEIRLYREIPAPNPVFSREPRQRLPEVPSLLERLREKIVSFFTRLRGR